MGGIISSLHQTYRIIILAIAELRKSDAQFTAVITRINAGPGLPRSKSTKPFWLNDPLFSELVNIQSPRLPTNADIVIIGSGITGAAIAWTLVQQCHRLGLKKKIVVVEARELSSGATGRNGGHIKTASYKTFAELKGKLGVEKALQVVRFQLMHLECLVNLCEQGNFEAAECRRVETADLVLGGEELEKAKREVEEFKRHLPDVDVKVWENEEARERFGINEHVAGAISYEAGALWPYRLVVSIWNELLSDTMSGVVLETSTPAESIDNKGSEGHQFRVHTPRGIIEVGQIVHATNAFAAHLLPGLKGKMAGVRGHMTAQKPDPDFPGVEGKRSWSIAYDSGFDYMTKRPGKAGEIMLGGGYTRSSSKGLSDLGVWEDDSTDPLVEAHLQGIVPAVFGDKARENRLVQSWSGIMGFTADVLPFVGKLDPRITGRTPKKVSESVSSSEWIAAGFCGEGMVMAWLSGVAVALMILGLDDEEALESPGCPAGKSQVPKKNFCIQIRKQGKALRHLPNVVVQVASLKSWDVCRCEKIASIERSKSGPLFARQASSELHAQLDNRPDQIDRERVT
ncbi:uncharacterized protein PAC_04542 [Phialocephala subalpina]|uniref:FAD dependent oxidoreductase domain-containing protein n=1 Tax=Phialocephala subalpina TaxID=576137 RepID=A0A1L7WPF9_9HELO|nr:uncharacterized protein PAC_04542 [Phialocephala subalpina]